MTAPTSGHRRVIPVRHGVAFEDLATYSPISNDFLGLYMNQHGLRDIADQIRSAPTNSS